MLLYIVYHMYRDSLQCNRCYNHQYNHFHKKRNNLMSNCFHMMKSIHYYNLQNKFQYIHWYTLQNKFLSNWCIRQKLMCQNKCLNNRMSNSQYSRRCMNLWLLQCSRLFYKLPNRA